MQKIDLDGLGPLPQRGKTLQLAMYARNAPKYPTLRSLREKLGFTNGDSANKAIQFRTLISNSIVTGFVRLTDSEEGAHIGNETSLDTCVRPATLREHAASSAVRYRGPTIATLKQLDMSAEEWAEAFGLPDGPPKAIHSKELAALKRKKYEDDVEEAIRRAGRERATVESSDSTYGPDSASTYGPDSAQITDGFGNPVSLDGKVCWMTGNPDRGAQERPSREGSQTFVEHVSDAPVSWGATLFVFVTGGILGALGAVLGMLIGIDLSR